MPTMPRPDRPISSSETATRDSASGSSRPGLRLVRQVGIVTAVSAALALLLGMPVRPPSAVFLPGDVADRTVRANTDFPVPDPQGTERLRDEMEALVPVVYDYEPDAGTRTLAFVKDDLEAGARRATGSEGKLIPDVAAEVVAARWSLDLPPERAAELLSERGRRAALDAASAALSPLYGRGVAANVGLLVLHIREGVVVRDLQSREERRLESPEVVLDYGEARRSLIPLGAVRSVASVGRSLAAAHLRPNLTYNGEETARRREAARAAVPLVHEAVRRGEVLVREGDRVTGEQAARLEAHARLIPSDVPWRRIAGVFGLTVLVLHLCLSFGTAHVRKFRAAPRDLLFLSSIVLLLALIERGILLAGDSLQAPLGFGEAVLPFVLPVAALTITVRTVLNSETAFLVGLPFLALACLPLENGLVFFLCYAAGGIVGAAAAARACHRAHFLRAGLWAGLAQAAAAGAAILFTSAVPQPGDLVAVPVAFAGGVLAGGLALGLVPLAEVAFRYTTDMRLMELASLDHPLLRQLMLRAPGTYHHSLVTGSLVKAAAEAIGARALLATVAAYYHDIGKLSKPSYFIENSAEGRSRHEKLSPSMSSLILVSHVKEGAELARQNRLGHEISEIVQQHHGTGLIHYFYDRACQLNRGPQEVREELYRYPGPKPQSREAALVLLADAVEAASRTLPDPRPARIGGLVQAIVSRVFTDGQLDDCDLTLRDLHRIARSFSRILSAIYHQRIDYPERQGRDRRGHGDLDPERLPGGRHRRGEASATGVEGLGRVGV